MDPEFDPSSDVAWDMRVTAGSAWLDAMLLTHDWRDTLNDYTGRDDVLTVLCGAGWATCPEAVADFLAIALGREPGPLEPFLFDNGFSCAPEETDDLARAWHRHLTADALLVA